MKLYGMKSFLANFALLCVFAVKKFTAKNNLQFALVYDIMPPYSMIL